MFKGGIWRNQFCDREAPPFLVKQHTKKKDPLGTFYESCTTSTPIDIIPVVPHPKIIGNANKQTQHKTTHKK